MQGKTIIIAAASPELAIKLIEEMTADLEKIGTVVSACSQDIRAIFNPLILDINAQLAAGYSRALDAVFKSGGVV